MIQIEKKNVNAFQDKKLKDDLASERGQASLSIFYIGESYSFIRSFIRGITSVTRNGLIVRARRAQEATYVISPTGKGSGKRKRGMALTPLRRCSFHVSSSLIACTVRFASRSPWKPAEKPIDSLFGDSSESELFQESLGPFPFLSYPTNLPRVFAGGEAFSSSALAYPGRVFRGQKRVRRSERRERGRESAEDEGKKEKREAERGGVVKRGLFR